MATASTIPTVKAALVTMLAARSALSGVQVTYAWTGAATQPESIWLDDPDVAHAAGSKIPTMKAGRKAREETYTVTVTFQVVQEGSDATSASTAEARVYALVAELDGGLADDPTLGGAAGVTGRVLLGGSARHLVPAQNGWAARVDVDVDVAARLA